METWHDMPMPHISSEIIDGLRFHPEVPGIPSSYWLVRAPLPELPKTQEKQDCSALHEFRQYHPNWTTDMLWFAALAYERGRK